MITLDCELTMNVLLVAVPDDLAADWSALLDRSAKPGVERFPPQTKAVADLAAAKSLLVDGNWFPDFVIVYQGIPDQFAAADVESFAGSLPLARCVVVFGPWCESIGRTEQCWPIGWCTPLQHAPVRLQQELAAWQRDEPPLPATASRDEAFVSSTVRSLLDADGRLAGQTVRIQSLDRAFGLFLAEAVQVMGVELVRTGERANIELLATTLIDDAVLQDVAQRRAANPEAGLLVVTEMATPADVRKLVAAGCDRVLSQLRFVEEFAATVSTNNV